MMNDMDYIDRFLIEENLPDTYRRTALRWFKPLAISINDCHKQAGKQVIMGMNGCQGSGKTTATKLLKAFLYRIFNKHVVTFSLDDFYLSKHKREVLAKHTHPLLATRGVPGTHDIALLLKKLDSLKHNSMTQLPTFNKATDDRALKEHWQCINGTPDIIIIEGWCLGTPPQDKRALETPVNTFEATHDPQGIWRTYVNDQLKNAYHQLNQKINFFIMLQAPSFDCVYQWRLEQEKKLEESLPHNADKTGLMSDEALHIFIQHYQRLTEHTLLTLPQQVHFLINLDENRGMTELSYPQGRCL